MQKGKNLGQKANLKYISLAENKFYIYNALHKLCYSPNIIQFIAFSIHDSKTGVKVPEIRYWDRLHLGWSLWYSTWDMKKKVSVT